MLHSEKRSLFRFLAIYLSSTFLLFFLATSIFYSFQKHQIVSNQENQLVQEAERITEELRQLNQKYSQKLVYPYHKPFQSAIYNLNQEYIFGSFHPQNIQWEKKFYKQNEKLFYIHSITPYYLGASSLIVSQGFNQNPLNKLFQTLAFFLLGAGILFTLLGFFLGKLFIAPMKESMERLNKFIEDTTHELNTPISTILTNIELLDTFYECGGKKEMQRIEIASKTLSRLYDDLTYLKLNHNYHRSLESLDISSLLEERIEFFKTLIESKKLQLNSKIERNIILEMDKNDAIRLIDNLLSNAIKYNYKQGKLEINLNQESLKISNSGIGIRKEEIGQIHNRFSRANSSEGGFGIGLDIVGQVVNCYEFDFHISSTYYQWTEVTIGWKK